MISGFLGGIRVYIYNCLNIIMLLFLLCTINQTTCSMLKMIESSRPNCHIYRNQIPLTEYRVWTDRNDVVTTIAIPKFMELG